MTISMPWWALVGDELELPVIVAESIKELAQQMGRPPTSLSCSMVRDTRYRWGHHWYWIRRVDV